MPRVRPRLFWQARAIDSLLPRLLPVCRDIRTSRNELRWLQNHAEGFTKSSPEVREHLLHRLVSRRSRGEPLQYILGSEFFGDIEIKCRPGVLIPRQETATFVSHLVKLLSYGRDAGFFPRHLKVLDLCCGSGCISLLFCHDFYSNTSNSRDEIELIGVDISAAAISLARQNLHFQATTLACQSPLALQAFRNIHFLQADVLPSEHLADARTVGQAIGTLPSAKQHKDFDIIICNPPYISSKDYRHTTYRSVRNFEPKLALVPPMQDDQENDGDLFYPQVLEEARRLKAKILLFEVSDLGQAKRVATLAANQCNWHGIEIWRDDPANVSEGAEEFMIGDLRLPIRGAGHGRSVLLYNLLGASLIGRTP